MDVIKSGFMVLARKQEKKDEPIQASTTTPILAVVINPAELLHNTRKNMGATAEGYAPTVKDATFDLDLAKKAGEAIARHEIWPPTAAFLGMLMDFKSQGLPPNTTPKRIV